MVVEEGQVFGAEPAEAEGIGEAEAVSGLLVHLGGEEGGAVVLKRHQMAVEEGVEVGGQEEAVEDVQALGIAGAFGPGFGVAGTKERRKVDARDGAGTAPVVHQAFPVDVLAHPLANQPFHLGRGGRSHLVQFTCHGFGKAGFRGIWEGAGEAGGLVEESAQLQVVAGPETVALGLLLRLGPQHLTGDGTRREHQHPASTAFSIWHHRGPGGMKGGSQDHTFRRFLDDNFPPVVVASLGDERAFEDVHGVQSMLSFYRLGSPVTSSGSSALVRVRTPLLLIPSL